MFIVLTFLSSWWNNTAVPMFRLWIILRLIFLEMLLILVPLALLLPTIQLHFHSAPSSSLTSLEKFHDGNHLSSVFLPCTRSDLRFSLVSHSILDNNETQPQLSPWAYLNGTISYAVITLFIYILSISPPELRLFHSSYSPSAPLAFSADATPGLKLMRPDQMCTEPLRWKR